MGLVWFFEGEKLTAHTPRKDLTLLTEERDLAYC